MLDKAKTRTELATALGISRKTLYNKTKKLNITIPKGLITPKKQIDIITALGYTIVNNHLAKAKNQ